tara:strand:- start:762 stop:1145 length:384 start_codon:yes stop_codon:yes gene_type:complete
MDGSIINSLVSLDPILRNSGRIHSSLTPVSLTDTNNTLLLTAPTGATLYLYCLMVYNNNASNISLSIGTGASLTERMVRTGPYITDFHYTEWFPLVRFESDIYVTASAASAADDDCEIQAFAIAVGQ